MAASANNNSGKSSVKKKSLIDPIYQKFVKSVLRALGSTEFYEFFMESIAHADNEFQFSNRRLRKIIDFTWVDAIEEVLTAVQKIISSPRNIIREDELLVNVAYARKTGPDVVRHLSQHAALVEKYNPEDGDVRPNRVMQKYREDTINLYENRLVYTTLETAYQFVKIRHDALFGAMSDELGAKLKVQSNMETATELVHMDLFLHIKETEGALETDEKNREAFERISRLYRVLSIYMNTPFAQQMAKLPRVRGAVTKTNVLKKNPDYRKVATLWDFLRNYNEIGYAIRVVEQAPVINEEFQRDIYHNILFNYLILKGYLEDERDRQIPAPTKSKKRTLKPKFIREIIEELTEDYDLPDVEIRKVLIEELTKEQLMQEEAAERRRLVEEQAKRKKEEQERIRQEKLAEKERLRQEREAEKERIRQEKAAEEERLLMERMEREMEDRRRSGLLKKELDRFQENLEKQLEARQAAAIQKAAEMQDFADAAQLLEEAEQRKLEQEARERKRRQDERDRIRHEKQLAVERARQEEAARLEREQQEQLDRDTAGTQIYYDEIVLFMDALPQRLAMRVELAEQIRKDQEQREQERQKRLQARSASGKRP